jgi:hypothetical protein
MIKTGIRPANKDEAVLFLQLYFGVPVSHVVFNAKEQANCFQYVVIFNKNNMIYKLECDSPDNRLDNPRAFIHFKKY